MSPTLDYLTHPFRAWRIAAFTLILAVAVAFPFYYRHVTTGLQDRSGQVRADADWAHHTAVIHGSESETSHAFGEATITCYFDADSGLPLRRNFHHGFERSYDRRISELLRIHGAPPWSQKNHFVDDADLVSMLTADTMKAVTAYPCEAAPGIVLLRNCSATHWGSTAGSFTNDLSIDSRFSGLYGRGGEADTAYVGRMEKYPDVVFVRWGQTWVAACTNDGWILSYASWGRREINDTRQSWWRRAIGSKH